MPMGPVQPVVILMAEDNPADVDLMRDSMERAKLLNVQDLHVVGDGMEALDFLRKKGAHAKAPTPDLVILDVNMPRKTGLEVLREIREDPALSYLPVVILTTSADEQSVFASYQLHVNAYITKPPDLAEFRKIVEKIDEFWLSIVKLPHPQSR